MSKVLYILRGAPGSGKTTLARQLAESNRKKGLSVAICEADKCFVQAESESNIPSKSIYDPCADMVNRVLSEHDVIIADGILPEREDVEAFIKIAIDNHMVYSVIRLDTKYPNTHGVPEEDVQYFIKSMKPFSMETVIG